MSGPRRGQKRALDVLEVELQVVVTKVWELNSGPLEGQPVLLAAKPTFQQEQSMHSLMHSTNSLVHALDDTHKSNLSNFQNHELMQISLITVG